MTGAAKAGSGGFWILWIDGGARGNPGPAGAGAILRDPSGRVVSSRAIPLGRTTNNDAEYAGLIHGLEMAKEAGVRRLEVRSDSELLVRQMTGVYRIRAHHLLEAAARARELLAGFEEVGFAAIPREDNREADRLANRAMDEAGRAGNTGKASGMVSS